MALSGKSLNGATAVGPGIPIIPDTPKQQATMHVTTTGSPTYSIALQGSTDGETWFDLNATIVSVSSASQIVSTRYDFETSGLREYGMACTAFRANLTSLSGGDSPTVTASIAIKP